MKSILLVIENVFMMISICMVEFRSSTLHNLDIAERVMIMRFALLGILLYLGANIIRLALMAEQAYQAPPIDQTCVQYVTPTLSTTTCAARRRGLPRTAAPHLDPANPSLGGCSGRRSQVGVSHRSVRRRSH